MNLDKMDWWRFLATMDAGRDLDLRDCWSSTDFGETIRSVSALQL